MSAPYALDFEPMIRPDSLDTSDVDGATSRPLPVRHSFHPFNTNFDVDRSTPSVSYRGKAAGQWTRSTNALNPDYQFAGFSYHPLPPETSQAKDILWTLPQRKWKPETRQMPQHPSDSEKYGRTYLFQQNVPARESLRVADICGPQFRTEETRWRKTDPLMPVYRYDGNEVEQVRTKRPHYGSMFARSEADNFALRTDDILTEKIFNREYPKSLIATRVANRTDDITGAQANTRSAGPRLWKTKDPSGVPEKLTNRVIDIDGALAGTAGGGPLLYRTRKQAAVIAAAHPRASTAAASASRNADIAAVKALS